MLDAPAPAAGPAVAMHGLATALPPHVLTQEQVATAARAVMAPHYPQFDRLASSFRTAGVERRHAAAPLAWFMQPRGWRERNAVYLEAASALYLQAARAALARAGWSGAQVDICVTVSTTGIATPSLEARVASDLGLRSDVMRVPVFGLGCAGGVAGLEIARALAAARPGARVLLVVVETCTLSFRADRARKADVIAAILFGDGAAGVCLSTRPIRAGQAAPRVTIGPGHQTTWPDTLDIMGWEVDDAGMGVVFDRSIPDVVRHAFPAAARAALAAAGLTQGDIARFVCHPGGARVLEALEAVLDLGAGALDAEREVLREAGNMSAPTVLFVLEAVLRAGATGQMMACALGPGFTAAFVPLRVVAA